MSSFSQVQKLKETDGQRDRFYEEITEVIAELAANDMVD